MVSMHGAVCHGPCREGTRPRLCSLPGRAPGDAGCCPQRWHSDVSGGHLATLRGQKLFERSKTELLLQPLCHCHGNGSLGDASSPVARGWLKVSFSFGAPGHCLPLILPTFPGDRGPSTRPTHELLQPALVPAAATLGSAAPTGAAGQRETGSHESLVVVALCRAKHPAESFAISLPLLSRPWHCGSKAKMLGCPASVSPVGKGDTCCHGAGGCLLSAPCEQQGTAGQRVKSFTGMLGYAGVIHREGGNFLVSPQQG